MRQVHQEDESDEQEQARANHGKVVAPHDEERVRDEEGQDNHANPAEDLGRPEAVLYRRAPVLRRPHANQHQRHQDVEEGEGEVDPLHCDIAVALLSVALDVHVVKGEVRQLLHGPVGEHDPRNDRVDEEDERIGDTRGDAASVSMRAVIFLLYTPVTAFPSARAQHSAAGGSSAAGGGNAPYLVLLAARGRVEGASVRCPWRAGP